MKKSVLFVAALAFGATSAFAQLETKKGEAYLPESGDWSIGIDANPVLNYFGNMIGGNGSNVAPSWNFLDGTNQLIVGKMYTSETSAYRALLRIGMNSMSQTEMIGDAAQTTPPTYPALPSMKEDKMKYSSHFVGLGAGIEMRRGKTRLQGYYGGEFMFWLEGSKETYTYGNTLSNTVFVNSGTTTDFGTGNITTDTYGNGARITEWKSGSTFGLGLRGFIGAEYFVLPKISVGGEFGWGLGIMMMGASSTTTESVGGSGPSVGTQTIESGKGSMMSLDVDNAAFGGSSASLRLNFHF